MNIDLLSKMVKELILENDRVVLPGLGCFVAELEPASFSDKGFTINPPYRRLFFRSKPDEGTELISFYALNNKLEEDIAEKILIDFLDDLKSVLETKKVVIFPGLGRLRATKENNFFFVADENLDIYEDGFALETISLKSHEETPEAISVKVNDLTTNLPSTKKVEVTEPDLEPRPKPKVADEEVVEKVEKKKLKPAIKALIIISVIIVVIILALIIFVLLAREYPDIMDQYLYTKEELEIINTVI